MRSKARRYQKIGCLLYAAWLRDLPDDVKGRLLLAGVADGDAETMAAMLAAPRAWNICTPLLREKAQEALMRMHDPEKADLLRDQKIFDPSVPRKSRKFGPLRSQNTHSLWMPPAKKAA